MADPLVDANTRHQLYLERLASANANSLDPTLSALATFVRSRLAEEGSSIPSQAAMNRIIKDVRTRFMKGYTDWENETEKYLRELSDYETQFQTDLLDDSTTEDFTPKKPTNKSTKQEVQNTPMMIGPNGGAVAITGLVNGFAKSETDKVTSLIQTGYYQGRSTSDITASITGTRANRFQDGVMAATKRNATSISKTSTTHVSTSAKDNVYRDNERAVKGYILTAVLDSRTSKICRGLDDTRVSFDDTYQPKPPFHVNCRTTTRPWLREDLDAVKKAERQTIGADGKEFEPTGKQYYTWLKQQPAWFQDDILGPTEGKIFRNAGLSPQEFRNATIKRDGTPLTISEMAQKDDQIKEYLRKSA